MKNRPQMSHALGLNLKETMMKRGMEFVRKCLILSALVLPLFWSSPAGATPLVPTSYTATPGEGTNQGGYFNYFDDTGSQLTDGIYGVNDYSADLGNGPAYEWVGWRVADPVITFQFSAPVTINQVGIDFNRTETNLIFLPPAVTIGGTDFTVDPNAIPDDTRGTLFFNGSWTGTTLTVDLTDNNTNNWIFVDEITFNSVVVPEPSVFVLLAVSLGLLILRVRRSRTVCVIPRCP
jgi:hypothetical protein